MMERMLSIFPDQLPHLIECLEKTRAIAQVPQLFEFTAHPMVKLAKPHLGSSHWVPLVKSIVCPCDLDTCYQSKRHSILLDSKVRKRKADAMEKQSKQTKADALPGWSRVLESAQVDHFKQTCRQDSFYSIDSVAKPSFSPLDDFLGQSRSIALPPDNERAAICDHIDRPAVIFKFGYMLGRKKLLQVRTTVMVVNLQKMQ